MARHFYYQTVDPNHPEGPKIKVVIPGDLIIRYYKDDPVRYQNFVAVQHVLDNPKRIFSGVRMFNEGGWCYVGRPSVWCIKDRVAAPFPSDKVFSVYLNLNMFVYEYRAEYSADDEKDCPKDWKNRYRGLVWKNIS